MLENFIENFNYFYVTLVEGFGSKFLADFALVTLVLIFFGRIIKTIVFFFIALLLIIVAFLGNAIVGIFYKDELDDVEKEENEGDDN